MIISFSFNSIHIHQSQKVLSLRGTVSLHEYRLKYVNKLVIALYVIITDQN